MKHRSKTNGSSNDDWETPDWLLKELEKEFGKLFDPCPLHTKFDGLKIDWKSPAYINPPFNNKVSGILNTLL